jgi:hypothetical protein
MSDARPTKLLEEQENSMSNQKTILVTGATATKEELCCDTSNTSVGSAQRKTGVPHFSSQRRVP